MNHSQIKKVQGRPTKYTTELGDKFIELISEGNSIVQCCKMIGISRQTFYHWLATEYKKEDCFLDRYREAKNNSYESYFDNSEDEAIRIYLKLINEGIEKKQASAMVKIIMDTKKWTAERLMPDKFATKTESNVTLNEVIIEPELGNGVEISN